MESKPKTLTNEEIRRLADLFPQRIYQDRTALITHLTEAARSNPRAISSLYDAQTKGSTSEQAICFKCGALFRITPNTSSTVYHSRKNEPLCFSCARKISVQ